MGNRVLTVGQTSLELYWVAGKVMTTAQFGELLDEQSSPNSLKQKRTDVKGPVCVIRTRSRDQVGDDAAFPSSLKPRSVQITGVAHTSDSVILNLSGDPSLSQIECLGSSPTIATLTSAFKIPITVSPMSWDPNHLVSGAPENTRMIFSGKSSKSDAASTKNSEAGEKSSSSSAP